ncbi:ATP-dependent helicase [Cupriavidus numazuensis]|uniref:DNA 3'-5' helicase n=1 Tax=Cupriavidus numazuensis TaxID=221992 RepID=A0ABM8TN01_9BURK|nr:ATP-dependent helicase [Cupriavidus numazuensis]CAG2155388.1 ATP-dependent DNA helicase PcrA [Cupriavidus numazuensis]
MLPSLDDVLNGLNPAQREVVDSRRNCLAVAVPGAGKTATIAAKAAVLLSEPGVTVGAVTFSRDAAIELRDRIIALAGAGAKNRLLAGTFHSLAYKQLGQKLGKKPDIATDGSRLAMVTQVLHDAAIEMKVEDAVSLIERLKTDLDAPPGGTVERQIFDGYQGALARSGMLDFQDMIRLAVVGLQDRSITPYQVDYLLLDEYQDCDELQYLYVAETVRQTSCICCAVGDDDQSIYAFRAAMGARGMQAFVNEFAAQTIVLGKNYRSRAEILAVSDKVIANNKDRIPKQLLAHRGPGGAVAFNRYDDEYKEAIAAIETLAPKLRQGMTAAVLARTNRILDPYEAVARAQGVKYFRAAGRSILDQPESALLCTLIELIQMSRETGLDSLLGYSGIASSELELLHAAGGPKNPDIAKRKDLVALGLSEVSADKYRDLLKRLAEWRSLYSREFYALVLDGVREWMLKWAQSDKAKRAITTTYDVLSRLNGSFTNRLEFLRRKNNEPSHDALVLTTLHASKGREYDHVCMVRVEETVLPDDGSTEAEERRLCYVGMTRAKDSLSISTAKKNPTSRFVVEAGLA